MARLRKGRFANDEILDYLQNKDNKALIFTNRHLIYISLKRQQVRWSFSLDNLTSVSTSGKAENPFVKLPPPPSPYVYSTSCSLLPSLLLSARPCCVVGLCLAVGVILAQMTMPHDGKSSHILPSLSANLHCLQGQPYEHISLSIFMTYSGLACSLFNIVTLLKGACCNASLASCIPLPPTLSILMFKAV